MTTPCRCVLDSSWGDGRDLNSNSSTDLGSNGLVPTPPQLLYPIERIDFTLLQGDLRYGCRQPCASYCTYWDSYWSSNALPGQRRNCWANEDSCENENLQPMPAHSLVPYSALLAFPASNRAGRELPHGERPGRCHPQCSYLDCIALFRPRRKRRFSFATQQLRSPMWPRIFPASKPLSKITSLLLPVPRPPRDRRFLLEAEGTAPIRACGVSVRRFRQQGPDQRQCRLLFQ